MKIILTVFFLGVFITLKAENHVYIFQPFSKPEVPYFSEATNYQRRSFDPFLNMKVDSEELERFIYIRRGDETKAPILELHGKFLFIDGTNPKHIAWAQSHDPNVYKWVLVKSNQFELIKEKYLDKNSLFAVSLGSPEVFYDIYGALSVKCGVSCIPCKVVQEEKCLTLEEVPVTIPYREHAKNSPSRETPEDSFDSVEELLQPLLVSKLPILLQEVKGCVFDGVDIKPFIEAIIATVKTHPHKYSEINSVDVFKETLRADPVFLKHLNSYKEKALLSSRHSAGNSNAFEEILPILHPSVQGLKDFEEHLKGVENEETRKFFIETIIATVKASPKKYSQNFGSAPAFMEEVFHDHFYLNKVNDYIDKLQKDNRK